MFNVWRLGWALSIENFEHHGEWRYIRMNYGLVIWMRTEYLQVGISIGMAWQGMAKHIVSYALCYWHQLCTMYEKAQSPFIETTVILWKVSWAMKTDMKWEWVSFAVNLRFSRSLHPFILPLSLSIFLPLSLFVFYLNFSCSSVLHLSDYKIKFRDKVSGTFVKRERHTQRERENRRDSGMALHRIWWSV